MLVAQHHRLEVFSMSLSVACACLRVMLRVRTGYEEERDAAPSAGCCYEKSCFISISTCFGCCNECRFVIVK